MRPVAHLTTFFIGARRVHLKRFQFKFKCSDVTWSAFVFESKVIAIQKHLVHIHLLY